MEESLRGFVLSRHREERYGQEEEYTARSLKAGIKAILTDIRGLVKAHDKFVQLSTYDERNEIHNCLGNMAGSLNQGIYSGVADHLNELKIIIRSFHVRGSSETQETLQERLNRINAECAAAEENISEIARIREKAEQEEQKFQSAGEKIEPLDSTVAELQQKMGQLGNLQRQSQRYEAEIENILTTGKSHEGVINEFVQRVERRQEQLDKQEQSTTAYQEKLESFQKEHESKLGEAENLIEKAREALGYRTAEGISAAFDERYIEEKKRVWWMSLWLVGATTFVAASIVIGIQTVSVWGSREIEIGLGMAVSRIAIMSVALSSAWFCAAQYVKYRNTREDYGYKAVLSKSIVAFLDQLKGEERERYLEIMLTEIHKDPLRKRHDESDSVGQKLANTLRSRRKKEAEAPSMSDEPRQ